MSESGYMGLAEHGNHRGYVAGCDECRLRKQSTTNKVRSRKRSMREHVNGRWISVHPRCAHGTYNAYVVYACRCARCTEAKSIYERDLRRRKRDHGT